MITHFTTFGGSQITSSGASVTAAIKDDTSGRKPIYVRISATGSGAYIRASVQGDAATNTDALILPGDSQEFTVYGYNFVSAMSVSGTSTINIATLEKGGWNKVGSIPGDVFTPSALFAQGEQGTWYDPSDITTMFQDSAENTPVTGIGQPVGLILDKSKGLLKGPESVSNSGNPFTTTVGWSDQAGNAPLSVDNGNLVATPNSVAASRTDTPIGVVSGVWYIFTVNAIQYSGAGPTFAILTSRNGTVVPGTPSAGVIGIKRFIFQATSTTTYYLAFGSNVSTIGVPNIISSASIQSLAGSHASQSTAANRPVYQIDGNGKSYLAFNGTNSSLSTASINFSATDKMAVFAGVRNISGTSIITELSVDAGANIGSFYAVAGSDSGGVGYTSLSTGTGGTQIAKAFTFPAPNTSVLSITHNISASISTIRRNTVAGTDGNGAIGTGNFGNYPLFIGARNNASLFFNGNLYSLIVRGAQSTQDQIEKTETYVNSKTGAY